MALLDLFTLILVATAGIGAVNHLYVRLPPPIGLLLGSLAICVVLLALDPLVHHAIASRLREAFAEVDLPHVFLDGVLGYLLFAASLHVSLSELRDNRWTVLLLSIVSVIVSTAVFCFGLYGICRAIGFALPLPWCGVIGAILAPTDAVVVDGILRRVWMPPALRAAITGESLLNDGAGVVLFAITLRIAAGETGLIGHGRVLESILVAAGGGVLVGGLAGVLTAQLMTRVAESGLNLLASLALVLFTYRLAHALEVSGPVAVAAAGLALGRNTRPLDADRDWRPAMLAFWSLLDGTLTAVLFILIGLQLVEVPFQSLAWLPVIASVPLALGARLASVGVALLVLRGNWGDRLRSAAVLTWAGMRGGVSVAMVLATPATPYRAELLAIAFAVVLCSTVAQGLTMRPLVQRLFAAPQP